MKHTPTPWMYTGNIDPNHIQKTQLVLQAKRTNSANIAKIIPCGGMTAEEVEGNAKRIVECVNALAGIEDPLKMRETWDIVKELELDAYHTLKEKTQKLLEALQFCKSVIQSGGMFERSEQLAVEQATEAINLLVS